VIDRAILFAALLFLAWPAQAVPFKSCFKDASQRYGVDPQLLVAIAKTESSMNPNAVGPKNANGTYDMGIMQINSEWLPRLSKFGIDRAELMQVCTNIHVGAWIMAHNIARHGSTWKAVGAYNASSASKQAVYATKVRDNYVWAGQMYAYGGER